MIKCMVKVSSNFLLAILIKDNVKMIFGMEMVFINGKTWINMKDNLLKVKNPEWEYYKDRIKMFIMDNG